MNKRGLIFLLMLLIIFSGQTLAFEIGGELRTVFDKAYYGDDDLSAYVWAHPEILDLQLYNQFGQTTEAVWELPQNEYFVQEYEFMLNKELADEIELDLNLIAKHHFTENKRKAGGDNHPDPPRDLRLHQGSIELNSPTYQARLGHIDNVVAEDYYLSGKDLEGFELKRDVLGLDMHLFGGGYYPDYLVTKEGWDRYDPHYDRDFFGIVFGNQAESVDFYTKYYFINNNELVNLSPTFAWQISDSLSYDFEFVYNYCDYVSDYYQDELAKEHGLDTERDDILVNSGLSWEDDTYNLELRARSIGPDFQLVYADRLEAGVDELSFTGGYSFENLELEFDSAVKEQDGARSYSSQLGLARESESGYLFEGAYQLRRTKGDFANQVYLNLERDFWRSDDLKFPFRLAGQYDSEKLNFVFWESGLNYQISPNTSFNLKLNYLIGRDRVKQGDIEGNRLKIDYIINF